MLMGAKYFGWPYGVAITCHSPNRPFFYDIRSVLLLRCSEMVLIFPYKTCASHTSLFERNGVLFLSCGAINNAGKSHR